MRIAIVTGASSGIGREFVNQIPGFYKHLDEIWVTARRGERLEEVKQEVEGRTGVYVRIFAGDLEKDLVYKQILNRLENQARIYGCSSMLPDSERSDPPLILQKRTRLCSFG